MLKLLKWVFYLIASVAVIVLAGSFFLPPEAVVTRSAEIAAPPEKVFAIVGDVHRLNEFSPWAERDPDMKVTYEGPATGPGSKMSWVSDDPNVGSGSQTVTDYEPPTHVAAELDFGPMGKAIASWDLKPSATGTTATWGFRAPLAGIPAKWFGLMFDRWVGADYEKGLAKLKIVAEKPDPVPVAPVAPAAPAEPAPTPVEPAPATPAEPAPAAPVAPAQ